MAKISPAPSDARPRPSTQTGSVTSATLGVTPVATITTTSGMSPSAVDEPRDHRGDRRQQPGKYTFVISEAFVTMLAVTAPVLREKSVQPA